MGKGGFQTTLKIRHRTHRPAGGEGSPEQIVPPFGNDTDAAFPVAGVEQFIRFLRRMLKGESQHGGEIARLAVPLHPEKTEGSFPRIMNAASAVSTPAEGVFLIGMAQGSYKLLFVEDPNWITQRWEK